jgi:hypothetical protein
MAERDLPTLLRNATPSLHPAEFVFCTRPDQLLPNGLHVHGTFHEAEGLTLIVEQTEAVRHAMEFAFPCRMISLNVHSALDAVGFLAAVMAALAARGISTNAVSAFYHDHLFVPRDRGDEALSILRELAL